MAGVWFLWSEEVNWPSVQLGAVAKIQTGKSNREDAVSDGQYVFFDRSQEVKRSSRFLFDTEAVIMPGEGSEFIPRYFEGSFDLHQRVYAITDFHGVDGKFLYYVMVHKRKYFEQVAIGATVKSLRKGMFERFTFNCPSIKTQLRIASILSAYDDLIENNRRRIQLLEQAARLLYKEWFVHLRFPGHEHTKITNGIPAGWEKKTLGDMVKIAKGKNITKDSARDGPIPVVAGGLTPAYYHDTANVHGPVITVSASGANAGYVNLYHEDIWASDCSYISRASTEYLYYLYLLLLSKQRKILGFQKGAAQPHVYPRDLERLTLNVPIEICIRQFEKFASPIFCRIGLLLEQNRKLVKARDLLLPRLMNGDFVCQERMLKRPHDD